MGTSINHSDFLNKETKLVDIIQLGFLDIDNNDFTSLVSVADYLIENFSNCFWGYCFRAIADTGINLTKPIPNLSYVLNDDDIQDDVKARLYFAARTKYAKTPPSKYETICSFYPDIPGDKRNEWHRSETLYDIKLAEIQSLKAKYLLIEQKYLYQMRVYSVSEAEVAIVHNIELFGKYIDHALNSLKDYNNKVETFVKNDFKKTPNPGNKNIFSVYMGLLFLSIILATFAIGRSIFSLVIKTEDIQNLHLVLSILSSIGLLLISIFFLLKEKLFFKFNPIFPSLFMLLAVVVASLNIVSVFTKNELDVFISFFIGGIGLIGIFTSLIKVRFYMPRNTYKCGSYIGNYKALCTNNFKVNFTYQWDIFHGGEELESGDISDFLSPYFMD